MRKKAVVAAGAVGLSFAVAFPRSAAAQERDEGWETATTITMLGSAGTQLLMPRIFYSDPEVTVGWKARWHVSVLAPVMTLTALAVLNEHGLKDSFEGFRPGCNETNQGGPGCETFGMLSTHSFGAFAGLGHGTAVFLVDTLKWSNGRVNVGSLVGNIGVPLVLSTITAVGRSAGDWEDTGQIVAGGGAGLLSGFAMGFLYASLQRPECGYTGSLICW